MSNEHYNVYRKADIPNLTQLDRQLLGHYCQCFNVEVTPPRAWPPLSELKLITGAHEKSISRSLGRLNRLGLIYRVTLASNTRGLKAQYGINLPLLKSYIKVTDELPNTSIQVTEQSSVGNSGVLGGSPTVTNGEPYSYPKPNKPNKPNKRNYAINVERWQVIMNYLSDDTKRRINPERNSEELLDELVRQGYRLSAIGEYLERVNFSIAPKVGGLFIHKLEQLAGVKSERKSSVLEWCGKCDKESRQFLEPSTINGVETYDCPTCSPHADQLKKVRDDDANPLIGEFKDFFRKPEDLE